MKHFYEVIAKCGHVGKRQYYEGHFFEKADNASEAAAFVRKCGRVKHDHQDAILAVTEITKSQYIEGIEAKKQELYFNCNSRYKQKAAWLEIKQNVRPEPKYLVVKIRKQESNKSVYYGKDKIRKPNKYIKLNPRCFEYNYELIGA